MADANTEEFICSLHYMDTRQLGEITAFGIAILGQVTSDVLTCTISEAQDTLPINGNMTIFMQELLIDIAAHAARHGTDAITLETNNGVLCTQRELRGRRSRPTVKAVKQRIRSAI